MELSPQLYIIILLDLKNKKKIQKIKKILLDFMHLDLVHFYSDSATSQRAGQTRQDGRRRVSATFSFCACGQWAIWRAVWCLARDGVWRVVCSVAWYNRTYFHCSFSRNCSLETMPNFPLLHGLLFLLSFKGRVKLKT
jgi:hypothetical protein